MGRGTFSAFLVGAALVLAAGCSMTSGDRRPLPDDAELIARFHRDKPLFGALVGLHIERHRILDSLGLSPGTGPYAGPPRLRELDEERWRIVMAADLVGAVEDHLATHPASRAGSTSQVSSGPPAYIYIPIERRRVRGGFRDEKGYYFSTERPKNVHASLDSAPLRDPRPAWRRYAIYRPLENSWWLYRSREVDD